MGASCRHPQAGVTFRGFVGLDTKVPLRRLWTSSQEDSGRGHLPVKGLTKVRPLGQALVLLRGLRTAREAPDQTHILMPAGGERGVQGLLQNGTGIDWNCCIAKPWTNRIIIPISVSTSHSLAIQVTKR